MKFKPLKIGEIFLHNATKFLSLQEVCYQYWPSGRSKPGRFGEYTVELLDEERQSGFVVKTLNVHNSKVSLSSDCTL